jgi:uncharacterized protein YcbK (DUF882 family)
VKYPSFAISKPETVNLSQRLPTTLRPLSILRRIVTVAIVVIAGVAIPSANARKNAAQRHPRLHALAHAFVNVALPEAGILPDYEDALPEEGEKYEIKLAHRYTGDMLDVVYRVGDTYIPEALDQLNNFLRDTHNEEVNQYDPRTFDLLHTMLAKLGKSNAVIDVLSGYRSQETNDELRASGTTNAAEHSQHIVAKAVDLRVDGVPAPVVRDAALSLNAGGVGYYPKSQFVHVDVGPVRTWTYTPHAAHRHSRHTRRAHHA